MKISVIIPAHNEEMRLEHSLRAIMAQDHADYEVIVVDNASTDRTAEIARSFGVKVVPEMRKGTMWACESGRQNSLGDIIVRMDADCLPLPTWLSSGAKYFDDPDVVGVSGPYDYHDSKAMFRNYTLHSQKIIYSTVNHIAGNMLNMGAVMIGGNSFFRAEALDKMGGFNTDIYFYGDDAETAKRLSKHGKVVFDKNLIMKTSARRFDREGVLKIQAKYLFHFFKHLFSRVK